MYKHQELLDQMTLLEKTALLSGKTVWQTRDIPRLSIHSIFCSDGPHGIRKQAGAGDHLGLNASVPATCFPPAGSIANSWNESLGYRIGEALGEEACALDVNVVLGPGLNIKRSPLCGRNFEYFSEDPYLSGKMAASYIRGIGSKGAYACPKHFAVNSQELRRMAMNAVVDERTLREIYLTGFEIAVKEGGAKAIMTSYNEVNGTYANENTHLLQDILRMEWGYEGIVITDWGGSNDHTEGVKAGSNLEMPAPGLGSARSLRKALKKGKITEQEIDQRVDELLDAVLTLSAMQEERKKSGQKQEFSVDIHHALAKEAALQSMVLLKNEDQILPLSEKKTVALIGDFAFEPRYQGAGSSAVNPTRLESMKELADQSGLQIIGSCRGYQRLGQEDAGLKEEALALAKKADVVLYCFGLDEVSESEGLDREHMRIRENQVLLIKELARVNENIVGILSAGSAVEMPWEDSCKAILHTYLSGQAGAGAVYDILTGRENPCGKLAETYPVVYEDTPAVYYYPSPEHNSEYREALYVGYRYYDTAAVAAKYPFGFGLSYTEFSYSDLQVSEKGVSFTLTNIGNRDGAEIAQLYVGKQDGKVFRPIKELKGFSRVFLKAGESKKVEILFDDKTFRFWNVKSNSWESEGGTWEIMVAASCQDVRLHSRLERKETISVLPYKKEELSAYYSGQIQKVNNKQFETLLGYGIPSGAWEGSLGRNDALCQMCYARSGLARLICKLLKSLKERSEKRGKPDLNILFQYNMPFRALAKMSNGWISDTMVDGIVRIVNLRPFSGLGLLIGGFFTNLAGNLVDSWRLNHGK